MLDPLNAFMDLASNRAISAATGPQTRLQLAVKDMLDAAASRTRCENRQKLRESPAAHHQAVAAQQLLNAGAVNKEKSLTNRRVFPLMGPRHSIRDLMALARNITQQQ